jgi:hypothetical protein
VSEFLVEAYLSRVTSGGVGAAPGQLAVAAEQLSREGTGVTFLHAISVPEEETCFYLYRAPSAAAVREAAARAGLRWERITEARLDLPETHIYT